MTVSADMELLRKPVRPQGASFLTQNAAPYVFVVPLLVLLFLFIILPALMTVVLMFFNVDILAGTTKWVGMKNIDRAISRGEIANSLWVTGLYALMTVIPSIVFGLLAALAINALTKGAAFWRAVYFMPVAATLVAMSIVWRWMFLARRGIVDQTIGAWTGLTDWLNSTALSLPAVSIVGNWQQIAFVSIIYLAAISSVPKHLLEAARLDGAGAFARFWHVTWPALGPATVFAVVISSIQALRIFDTIATMTEGGPSGSSETLTYLLWKRGIFFFDIGGGAVVTFVLLLLALFATFVQKRATRRLEDAGSR
ncbi:sugar ABC transporter permease (plasmid) [Phaeobacter sp. BS23]|uniref:carbohydrate ABC transporter permease n=1 Tax=Phaeobacter sp. BS23 TaxID=2907239 RepID=UPI00386353B5